VVWFVATPLGMDVCYSSLTLEDVFIAIGNSGHV